MTCHNTVRNKVGRFAASAGLDPTFEQAHLLPPRPDDPLGSNLRRPADVFLPSWIHGAPAALDFAVVSPQRQDVVSEAASGAGVAASHYEAHKRNFLNTASECQQQRVNFFPMVAESTGGWGPEGLKTLRRLAKVSAARTGSEDCLVLGQMLQSLCVAIRSAKARAVLRRGGAPLDTSISEVEAAETTLLGADAQVPSVLFYPRPRPRPAPSVAPLPAVPPLAPPPSTMTTDSF